VRRSGRIISVAAIVAVAVNLDGRREVLGIGRYLGFYNGRRPHSSLDGKTPDQAYFNALTPEAAAA
jgi:hypothetical protein